MPHKWGSYIVNAIGYSIIGWMIHGYGIQPYDVFKIIFWSLFIQWIMNFIKEIIEY